VKDYTIFEQQCPFCGHRCNRCATTDDAPPKPGDISLCLRCAEVSVFDRELRLRRASPRELTRLKSDPDWLKVERMRRAIRHFRNTFTSN
jgi:hypothetical protein